MSTCFPLGMNIRNVITNETAPVVGHAMVALPAIASDYTLPYQVVLVVIDNKVVVGWPEDEVVSAEHADRFALSEANDVYGKWRSR